jgi:uncharacterized protein (DUF362 family)
MAHEPLTRAEFLKILAAGAGGIIFLRGSEDALAALAAADDTLDQAALDGDLGRAGAAPYMTVVHGTPVATNVKTAIAKLGGMKRFVGSGDDVVIKPNICHPRAPQYAATTNPEVVATLVRLARAAGAKRVRVMDNPVSTNPSGCYSASGIQSAVKAAGGSMHVMSSARYVAYDIPGGTLKRHKLYRDMVECDVLINVPIAKQHGSTGLTLAGKNAMGCTNDRKRMHKLGLSRTIAELNAKLKPDLTVLDAIRILVRNGPSGGSLSDVKRKDIVIASKDWVAVDAYATRLFGKKPGFVPYIAAAAKMGLGKANLSGLAIGKYEV